MSRTKGAVDIYWGGQNDFTSGKHERAIATPLDLVDGLKITNNTNKSVSLSGINNESRDLLDVISEGRATPIILLPEKFIKNGKEEITCRNRNLLNSSINNICIFTTPIVITPKETVTLHSQLFAVPGGVFGYPPYTREEITFLDGKENKNIVYVTNKSDKQYVFLSNIFQEYDQVSESRTFNIGGLVLVSEKDKNFVNGVFDFRTSNGQKIEADIKSTTGLTIKSFELPQEGLEVEKDKFNDGILALQVFLYRNSFMDKNDIDGEYNDKTVTVIKQFQKSAGIVETGKPDSATLHVTRSEKFDNGIALYENYGDEALTLSFNDTNSYFRIFSIGTNSVHLGEYSSNPSFVTKCEGSYCTTSDGGEVFATGVLFLNNTTQAKSCTLSYQDKNAVTTFQIAPNEIYKMNIKKLETSAENRFVNFNGEVMYHFQCENNALDIIVEYISKG